MVSALTALCKSVVEASSLVSALVAPLQFPALSVAGAASMARNFELSSADKNKMDKATAGVKEAMLAFKASNVVRGAIQKFITDFS